MKMRSLMLGLLPAKRRAAAEAESKQWMATCPHCNAATSIWDLGGLRYKAAGRPAMRFRCPHCGKAGTHPIKKRG